jgi:hypothetical protein
VLHLGNVTQDKLRVWTPSEIWSADVMVRHQGLLLYCVHIRQSDSFVYVFVHELSRSYRGGYNGSIHRSARPTYSQPIRISRHCDDLVEACHDSSESKYSERKALLELTAVMESRTPR